MGRNLWVRANTRNQRVVQTVTYARHGDIGCEVVRQTFVERGVTKRADHSLVWVEHHNGSGLTC